jgi:hypothetical protein
MAAGYSVDLYWLPLGAGGHSVRLNGSVYEAILALRQRRRRHDLYHSALEVTTPDARYVIEMAPIPDADGQARGVVVEGPVGSRHLGWMRLFRYEVRRWPGGTIPDLAEAVESPRQVSTDAAIAACVLAAVPDVPAHVWGRDAADVHDMWNSNSLVSWLLVTAGVDIESVAPPEGGRAPGWEAGIAAAQAGSRRVGAFPPEPSRAFSRLSWIADWRSTPEERQRALPGDRLVLDAQQQTHAITIDAPPEAVWPWLVQIGQGRAGFYSHDRLERLFGADIHNADEIRPEWQELAVGDLVRTYRPIPPFEPLGWYVGELEPARSLVLHEPERLGVINSSWSLLLTREDEHTRLISRWRFRRRGAAHRLFKRLVFDPAHFVMETGVLHGLKHRAERDPEARNLVKLGIGA